MAFITPKNIPKFIMILPILGIIITSVLISGVTLYTIKQNFQKEKDKIAIDFMENLKNTTKQRVELTYKIIDALYQNNKTQKNGYEKTIHIMQQVLEKMRWNKKGYIFVFDFHGNTLYHPNKYYMLINRWNFERHGMKVLQLITKNALKYPDGTYVKYLGYNPDGSPKEKVSFVKVYKPLKIIIGNGVYLNYLDKKLLAKQKLQQKLFDDIVEKILIVSILISILMIIVMYLFGYILRNLFKKYDEEIRLEKQKLFIKANFDTLTNLHNRSYFYLELQEYISLIKIENHKLAILFIDLDHFKEINDSLGHQYGDEVLKITSQRLQNAVKQNGIVSRFGGDEFVVLLYDIISIDKLIDFIQKLLKELKNPIILNNLPYHISASIGVSISPNDGDEPEQLVKYSDIAMYKAKQSGKDRFAFYEDTMSDGANLRIKLKNSLYKALEKQEFELYFQPQIDKNEKLFGMETLIRWNNPEEGLISPFNFIPLAIEIGLIDKIDLWVIENSIIQCKKWINKGFNIGVISCNITMYQLEKNDFSEELKNLLIKHNLNAKYLNLEVTEESVMKNPKKSIEMLYKIKELGVKINIDDFGTGYSSLAYLKKLPISKLKIDRNFIKDIPDDKDDMVITKTIINLAKNLKLKIIAEGVETEIQKEFVFENGCDYIQGYFYSKPLPATEFEEQFLKEKKW